MSSCRGLLRTQLILYVRSRERQEKMRFKGHPPPGATLLLGFTVSWLLIPSPDPRTLHNTAVQAAQPRIWELGQPLPVSPSGPMRGDGIICPPCFMFSPGRPQQPGPGRGEPRMELRSWKAPVPIRRLGSPYTSDLKGRRPSNHKKSLVLLEGTGGDWSSQ